MPLHFQPMEKLCLPPPESRESLEKCANGAWRMEHWCEQLKATKMRSMRWPFLPMAECWPQEATIKRSSFGRLRTEQKHALFPDITAGALSSPFGPMVGASPAPL